MTPGSGDLIVPPPLGAEGLLVLATAGCASVDGTDILRTSLGVLTGCISLSTSTLYLVPLISISAILSSILSTSALY